MTEPRHDVFESPETVRSWDEDYYHPIAERYYDRTISRMLELMAVPAGSRVLDAGCGPGVHSIRVARAGHPVTAIDISDRMLEEARARVSRAGLADRVEFRCEDLTRLNLPDSSFRHAFSWGVVIHIPEIERALDELARILEPGGTLALYVTNRSGLDYGLEDSVRSIVRKPLDSQQLPMGRGIRYRYHGEDLWLWRVDVDALTRHLAGLGLRRTHRVAGQFSELQIRLKGKGPIRRSLLRFNNAYDRLRMPARWAVTNLLVFTKDG